MSLLDGLRESLSDTPGVGVLEAMDDIDLEVEAVMEASADKDIELSDADITAILNGDDDIDEDDGEMYGDSDMEDALEAAIRELDELYR